MNLRFSLSLATLLLAAASVGAQDPFPSTEAQSLVAASERLVPAGHLPDFKILSVRRELEEPGVVFWYVTVENQGAGTWPYEQMATGQFRVKLPSIAVKWYAPKQDEVGRGETDVPPFVLHTHQNSGYRTVSSLTELQPGTRFDIVLRAPSAFLNYPQQPTMAFLYFTVNWDRATSEESADHMPEPAASNNTFRW